MINKLDEKVINKIAAGEVVESPYSVLKELVENSIDAGSTAISVEWEDGGKSFLKVSDNGCGMSAEDAKKSLERHATSKIIEAEDLYSVRSYGFRGEGIAAVASVSNFEMITCANPEDGATRLVVTGGDISTEEMTTRSVGTTTIVSNIFYNQPVRQKFLKTERSESTKNMDMMLKLAQPNYKLEFTIKKDGKTVHYLPKASSFEERFYQINRTASKDEFLFVENKDEYYKMTAVVSHPRKTIKTRKNQFLYVNGRWVAFKNLGFLLRESYINIIPHDRNAIAHINIEIPTDFIEINIHPTKKEIRFYNESAVASFIINSIKFALTRSEVKIINDYSDKFNAFGGSQPSSFGSSTAESPRQPFVVNEHTAKQQPSVQQSFIQDLFATPTNVNPTSTGAAPEFFTKLEKESSVSGYSAPFFQAFEKFIITTTASGIVVIDQHAAHERILYDEAIAGGKDFKVESELLMFAETIELSEMQHDMAITNRDKIEQFGFTFRDFSGNTIVLETSPIKIKISEAKELFVDILDGLNDSEFIHLEPFERMIKTYACKAARKFGEKLTIVEMEEMVRKLFLTTNPSTCPHGRPLLFTLEVSDIEKKFFR